jgi:hypothetical protein
MALSNCAAHQNGETATTNPLVLGDDLPLFKFGLLTDIQHADKVRAQLCSLLLPCVSTAATAALHHCSCPQQLFEGKCTDTITRFLLHCSQVLVALCLTQDTVSFEGRPQRYRESAGKLQAALKHLSHISQQQQPQQNLVQPLSFVLTLGDIIDGYGGEDSSSAAAKASKDLKYVTRLISSGLQDIPAKHVLGNHCLAAPRSQLIEVSNHLAAA